MKLKIRIPTVVIFAIFGAVAQPLSGEDTPKKKAVPNHVQQYLDSEHLMDGISFQYFYEDGSGLEIAFNEGKVRYEWVVGPRKGNKGEGIPYQSRSIGDDLYMVNWHEPKKPDFTSLIIDLKNKALYSTAILRYGTSAEMIHFKEASVKNVKRPSE
ncbi:MoaF N-terminal domain-containing protein [Verrucomicrobiaceae bacterium N1E253]|uniref:MoaF N-terminal domain-containing protein n=1 Tax=Oceaniferula marina TaxID=2748318 RepID=A0A851GJW3_9BACT|nr:MoaF N-terminal domain-containing protein [Oceaniferula marina]NWK57626.1 MoaF N-terminal domain-containing protein [Oceaniferula marina]